MSSVTIEEKQLLFDYCVGISTPEQSVKASKLISQNQEAYALYSKFKSAFAPLDSIGIQNCPDELVETTLLRIRNIPSPNKELNDLLQAEQNRKSPIKIGFLRNFSEIAAIAAAVLIITGILVPTFGYTRNKYWQQQCSLSNADVFKGYTNYIDDHDGKSPFAKRAKGANWLKEPNTSHMYLLVTGNYVEPSKFICPAKRNRSRNPADKKRMQEYFANYQNYKDFPDRSYCSYSFPVTCQKDSGGKLYCRSIIMADSNPIFAQLSLNSPTIVVELNHKQLQINSYNHNNRGQNVLFGDGHVTFISDRQIEHDDIYTLWEYDKYIGFESPSCEKDKFLAP